jgi:hypothetical protein
MAFQERPARSTKGTIGFCPGCVRITAIGGTQENWNRWTHPKLRERTRVYQHRRNQTAWSISAPASSSTEEGDGVTGATRGEGRRSRGGALRGESSVVAREEDEEYALLGEEFGGGKFCWGRRCAEGKKGAPRATVGFWRIKSIFGQ